MFERRLRGPRRSVLARAFSFEEDALIEELHGQGKTDPEIAVALSASGKRRSASSVASRRDRLGLTAESETSPVACNDAFYEAMMLAVHSGKEQATFGVFKDETPFVGKLIHPEPVFSGCGSQASLAADTGPVGQGVMSFSGLNYMTR